MSDVIAASSLAGLSLGGPLALGVSACGPTAHALDAGGEAMPRVDARVIDAALVDDAREADAPADDVGMDDAWLAPRTSGHASFTPPGERAARYVTQGETIEDELTGLVWERVAGTSLLTLDEAHTRCDALALEGQDDFRVPSRVELVSLLRTTRSPTIDPIFEATEAEYHWTRSLHPRRDTSATSVYFGAAEIVFALAADRSALVRCVRGGTGDGPGPTLEGTRVVDRGTQLVWGVLDTPCTYAEAVAGCDAIGMRVPTLDELSSLVDDTRTSPAIDLATLGGEAGPTWSSSAGQTSGERVGLDLSIGPSVRLREGERAIARCVTEAP